mgnify:CR=1 FL=1
MRLESHSEENKSSLKSESRILREEQEILEKLLRTSLEELDSFLDEATDDEAIAWLRESAKHTIESQQHSTDQPLRVALLGEFSSGKSRLINALLEEKILSVGLVPVTRSVTRIIHGKKIGVTVKHMDGTTVEVQTPPEAGDGWRLRLEGVAPGGRDHFLQLQVRTDEGLRVDGLRVLYRLDLPAPEGALGGPRSFPKTSQKRPGTLPEALEQC